MNFFRLRAQPPRILSNSVRKRIGSEETYWALSLNTLSADALHYGDVDWPTFHGSGGRATFVHGSRPGGRRGYARTQTRARARFTRLGHGSRYRT